MSDIYRGTIERWIWTVEEMLGSIHKRWQNLVPAFVDGDELLHDIQHPRAGADSKRMTDIAKLAGDIWAAIVRNDADGAEMILVEMLGALEELQEFRGEPSGEGVVYVLNIGTDYQNHGEAYVAGVYLTFGEAETHLRRLMTDVGGSCDLEHHVSDRWACTHANYTFEIFKRAIGEDADIPRGWASSVAHDRSFRRP